MSPFEHGEVFVLDDGGEVDLDLGNYEHFLDVTLTRDNNITTGKIYQSVLEKERKGDYLGKTVQVVPHITDAIKNWIESVAVIPVDGKKGPADVCVIELGGTVGDIESMPFIEALRQLSFSVGKDNFCLIHVSLIPVLGIVGEQKTKPTQHSVRELRALGLTPDLLACRSSQPLLENTKVKLSQLCHVPAGNILNIHDVSNIWHVPLLLRNQNAHDTILRQLNLLTDLLNYIMQKLVNRIIYGSILGKFSSYFKELINIIKVPTHLLLHEKVNNREDWWSTHYSTFCITFNPNALYFYFLVGKLGNPTLVDTLRVAPSPVKSLGERAKTGQDEGFLKLPNPPFQLINPKLPAFFSFFFSLANCHCINQLMPRGEYFLEGGTAVKVQLAIPYWAGSAQTSCCSNLVAPGEIPEFSEKFL
ncbi:hypothetical protein UlMin_036252 [Ulmus minor]